MNLTSAAITTIVTASIRSAAKRDPEPAESETDRELGRRCILVRFLAAKRAVELLVDVVLDALLEAFGELVAPRLTRPT